MQAAQLRALWRGRQGAVTIDTPDVEVQVSLNSDDSVRDIDLITSVRHSPSQTLVAEMMILTGQVIGDYGAHPSPPVPCVAELTTAMRNPLQPYVSRSRMNRFRAVLKLQVLECRLPELHCISDKAESFDMTSINIQEGSGAEVWCRHEGGPATALQRAGRAGAAF